MPIDSPSADWLIIIRTSPECCSRRAASCSRCHFRFDTAACRRLLANAIATMIDGGSSLPASNGTLTTFRRGRGLRRENAVMQKKFETNENRAKTSVELLECQLIRATGVNDLLGPRPL